MAVIEYDAVQTRIGDVEWFVARAYQARTLDIAGYSQAVAALADASIALLRAGTPAAQRPLRSAAEAEARLFRGQSNVRVRLAVRAAVAATVSLVERGDQEEANGWLMELATFLPSRKQRRSEAA